MNPALLITLLTTGIGTLGTASAIYISHRLPPGEDIPLGKLMIAGSVVAIGVGVGVYLITKKESV